MQDDTWVVVPAFNEQATLAHVIQDLTRAFPRVVCVDDCSTDNSGDIALEAGAIVIRHPVNLGQGAALQTGIEYARKDPTLKYVVTFDADGQHRPEDATKMVQLLRQQDLDIVFGSRFLDSRTRVGFAKKVVLKIAARYTSVVTKVQLTDAHNGLRAFNRRVADRMDLKQNRMAHASEIVAMVGAEGFSYAECSTHLIYSDYSRAKGQSLLNSINILTDLFFR